MHRVGVGSPLPACYPALTRVLALGEFTAQYRLSKSLVSWVVRELCVGEGRNQGRVKGSDCFACGSERSHACGSERSYTADAWNRPTPTR